ncbi:helix-hairpin-helix domain-containing protein [Amycolatopsis sp. NPDC004079]|uniref:helix-hairpin-helix domain-containing protein n=1 Tax=Amycolatopsis sp. NPDC004079 TaxID=3154549 RepID=UPI0033B118F5
MGTATDADGTPITALHRYGTTWHQTRPLRNAGITTVEAFADLAAQHENNPAASALADVPDLGPARIAMLIAALRDWNAHLTA